MKVLLATTNPGKIRETLSIFEDESWLDLVTCKKLEQLDPSLELPEVEETGQSFEENALLKAQAFSQATGLTTLADDSGLEVKALDNKPGVASARWVSGGDHDRNLALLKLLDESRLSADHDLSKEAVFVTVVCVFEANSQAENLQARDGGQAEDGDQTRDSGQTRHKFFRGELRGSIAKKPKGEAGFGYDPIFIPEGYTQTLAELGLEVKNKLSHRASALKQAKTHLKALASKKTSQEVA